MHTSLANSFPASYLAKHSQTTSNEDLSAKPSLRRSGRWLRLSAAGLLAGLLLGVANGFGAEAKVLRVFGGGPTQRPDILRTLLDEFQATHPGITVEISTGAATSELQRKYLSTLLGARDTTFDAFLIDIVNPAQYAAAGWLEPLDSYFPPDDKNPLEDFLPAQQLANRVDGKIVALPWVTDAQFLYYRSDLLEKYGREVPKTWDELAETAKIIVAGEANTALYGLSVQGAAIEGTVCTFLLPYWSQGPEFLDTKGRLTLDRSAALGAFQVWRRLIDLGVLRKSVAETKTGDTTNEFKAGNAVFAVNWGFAWGDSQRDPDSRVRGKVGIAPPPAVTGGTAVSSVGGWQWGVSAFSTHKAEAVELVRYLTARAALKRLTLLAGFLPSRTDLYTDAEILENQPGLKLQQPVVLAAKPRPITAKYGEVSDVLRLTTSAVLGGSLTPEAGVDEIQNRLKRVLR